MTASAQGAGPLAGCTVLDLTANMSGPYATLILAEQGADVIKVEPPAGDVIRRVGTGSNGTSTYFANLNRIKRSVVIDLQTTEGIEIIHKLAERADVMIQNFRPRAMDALGLGPDAVAQRHPHLIYMSITGFGRTGPLADAPAYDHVVQALSGMAARQRDARDGPPSLVRHGIVDKATGMFAAQAIVAALLKRTRTGTGEKLEVSMIDSALHFLWPDGMMNNTCLDEVDVLPPVAAGFRVTRTCDGHVALITVTDHQWNGMLRATNLQSVIDDPELQTVGGRMRHGGRIMRQVGARLLEMSTDDVVARMQANDVPCMPVIELEAVRTDPRIVAAGSLEEFDHPQLGRIVQPRPPARFDDDHPSQRTPSRRLGGDTDRVLGETGFSGRDIEDLRRRGIVS